MKHLIRLNPGTDPTLWCGKPRHGWVGGNVWYTADATDELGAATCVPCLDAKADHHSAEAVATRARAVEVLA